MNWLAASLMFFSFVGSSFAFAGAYAGASAGPELAVWSEFVPYAQVTAVLPHVAREGLSLFLAVRDAALDDPDFYATWTLAQALGVPIRPWLLLSEADGYWTNKWNADKSVALVHRFLDAMDAHGLSTDWVTLDIEPPPTFDRELTAELQKHDFTGVWKTLTTAAKSGDYYGARKQLRDLVDELHARGIRAHAVTTAFVIHDLANREFKVQNAMGTPVQGVPFDEVSFMLYRNDFIQMLGNVSNDIVYRYTQLARAHYGEHTGVDLGEVGLVQFPTPHQGYSSPAPLNDDYAATRAAGVEKIHVYSLDGIYPEFASDSDCLSRWFTPPAAKKPAENFLARFYLTLLDAVSVLLPKPSR
jgi:hypothetical protein